MIERLDEIEPAALWADSRLGFAWMVPGGARVFPVAELEQAKAWVADASERE